MTHEECATLRVGDVVYHQMADENLIVVQNGVVTDRSARTAHHGYNQLSNSHPYGVWCKGAFHGSRYIYTAWGDCLKLVRRAYPAYVRLPEGL